MDLKKLLVITWMDGEIATYENVAYSVLNDVLNVYIYRGSQNTLTEEWHFPIAGNIRAWGPQQWEPNHRTVTDVDLVHGGPR